MDKEEFYKTIRSSADVKNMDILLVNKAGELRSSDNLIIDAGVKEKDFYYALQKILKYHKEVREIVINASSNDGPDFIKAEETSAFITEGGFQKEYDEYLNQTYLDNKIKIRRAKMLQWQIWIFWPLFGISILSLLFSLYTLFFK